MIESSEKIGAVDDRTLSCHRNNRGQCAVLPCADLLQRCEPFTTTPTQQPSFTQNFPNLPNLTHPSWGTSFAVCDTFQVTILGAAPNKPVYVSGSSAGTVQLGQTDGSGRFSYAAVEQTSNIGSYTEVFSVGSVSATPAISFLVGQVGGNGTIATTDVGQIPDGSLIGVSSLSITNGVVSTYSSTSLDTTASLYYNSEMVATLLGATAVMPCGLRRS